MSIRLLALLVPGFLVITACEFSAGVVCDSDFTANRDDVLTGSSLNGGQIVIDYSGLGGEWIADTVGTEFDATLSVYDNCELTNPLVVNDDWIGRDAHVLIPDTGLADTLVVLEAVGLDQGSWQVNFGQLVASERVCDDGRDLDNDGDVDCDDSDCGC